MMFVVDEILGTYEVLMYAEACVKELIECKNAKSTLAFSFCLFLVTPKA